MQLLGGDFGGSSSWGEGLDSPSDYPFQHFLGGLLTRRNGFFCLFTHQVSRTCAQVPVEQLSLVPGCVSAVVSLPCPVTPCSSLGISAHGEQADYSLCSFRHEVNICKIFLLLKAGIFINQVHKEYERVHLRSYCKCFSLHAEVWGSHSQGFCLI